MKYTLLFASLISVNAFAETYQVQAKVLDIQPNYVTQQVPKEVCSMVSTPVQVNYPGQVVKRKTNTGKLIFNTLVGGAVGHQFGKGKGRDAATVVGALVGYNATEPDVTMTQGYTVTEYRQTEQCRTEYVTQQVQDGFLVNYSYNGLRGVTRTQYAPGNYMEINITLGE